MKNRPFLTILLLLLLVLASSCRNQKQDAVATVNGSPILLKDLQKELDMASERDPSVKMDRDAARDVLNTMVEKKLMVQEAVKKGLSEDERFIETIKRFWEQTLIRQLIDMKTKNWAEKIQVTDVEARRHYERMGYKATFRIARRPDQGSANEARDKMLKGIPADGEEVLGPLLIENILWSDDLRNSFDLKPGEAAVSKDDRGYSVVQLIKKERTVAPPFGEVSERIKGTLLEEKKQHALEEWLNGLKRSSKVIIDAEKLKRVRNDRN